LNYVGGPRKPSGLTAAWLYICALLKIVKLTKLRSFIADEFCDKYE